MKPARSVAVPLDAAPPAMIEWAQLIARIKRLCRGMRPDLSFVVGCGGVVVLLDADADRDPPGKELPSDQASPRKTS